MELSERFARGDLEAFESLFRQFQGEVYRWIVRIVRDSAIRVVAALALIEDRPYEEIAEALGTSVGAVKSRVFRAVRLL